MSRNLFDLKVNHFTIGSYLQTDLVNICDRYVDGISAAQCNTMSGARAFPVLYNLWYNTYA